jgi:hypothetical protein
MTLANAPLSARDARLNAPDLPDGTSEIFLRRHVDTPQFERRTDLPVGPTRRSEAHSFIVIPGHRAAMNPESISPRGDMDSGQPLRGFRNDEDRSIVHRQKSSAFSRDGQRAEFAIIRFCSRHRGQCLGTTCPGFAGWSAEPRLTRNSAHAGRKERSQNMDGPETASWVVISP